MLDFKAMVARDVKAVFIDESEFGEVHDINGKPVTCVIDRMMTQEANDTLTNPLDGVFVNAITIYVSPREVEKPVEGEVLMFDDQMCIVRSVSDEMGILVIVAEVNDQ